METLSIRYVFDKKKKMSDTVPGLLQIEVRDKKINKCVYISTGVHLYKGQFSDKNGFTCVKHPNAIHINKQARSIYNKVEAFMYSDKCKCLDDVKKWDAIPENRKSFVIFMRELLLQKNVEWLTQTTNRSFIKKVEDSGFLDTFDDVTYENIVKFDGYMRKKIKTEGTLYMENPVQIDPLNQTNLTPCSKIRLTPLTKIKMTPFECMST